MTDIDSYLNAHENKSLLRVLTCGSVDDGKSTLIGRLLYDSKLIFDDQLSALRKASEKNGTTGAGKIDYALLLDGLKAEREQGITIDVAYRFFTTPRRKFIIADCPGHEQYTRNMATGASTADLAIILIDARNGVLTQTRRHAFIVSLLGIRHLVVAINKMDLFGYDEEVFYRIRRQFADFAENLDIPDIHYIPISALAGENVIRSQGGAPWYTGPALLPLLEEIDISDSRNLTDFRFPVQYVIRPDLTFRGFAGSIVSGIIRPGDEVVALPSLKESRVKRIVTPEGDRAEAFAPQAVVLELEDEIDISAGEMIVRKGQMPRVSDGLEAHLIWLSEAPLVENKEYVVRLAGRSVKGVVSRIAYGIDVNTLEHVDTRALALNQVGRVVLHTHSPLFFDAYRTHPHTGAFILIDPLTNATAGAGMVMRCVEAGEEAPVAAHFITREERVARYGHNGCSVLVSGESAEVTSHWAQVLERTLFARSLHTFFLEAAADAASAEVRTKAELSYSLAEAGLICVTALPEFPARGEDSIPGKLSEALVQHVWVGATPPNPAWLIIDPASAESGILRLASLLADPSLAQYDI